MMATSARPGPDEPPDDESPEGRHVERGPQVCRPLSPRERRALARIEADLVSGDPCLEQRMSRGRTEPWRWLVRSVVAVPVGVFAGVAAWVLIPASWWALLAVVLTLVVMPCLLLWATEGWTKR